jgi:hypothetical protein
MGSRRYRRKYVGEKNSGLPVGTTVGGAEESVIIMLTIISKTQSRIFILTISQIREREREKKRLIQITKKRWKNKSVNVN